MPARRDPPPLWAQRARSAARPPAPERIDVASIRLRFAVAVLLAALAMLTVIAGLAAIS
jgi:hypothetical protein